MKTLTQLQEKKIRSQTKAGWSQKKIAKGLKVAKWRITAFQKSKKINKGRAAGTSEFWKDVKAVQDALGVPLAKARQQVGGGRKWGEKRAARVHKEYKTWREFWDEMEKEALTLDEKKEILRQEEEEFYFGTPT